MLASKRGRGETSTEQQECLREAKVRKIDSELYKKWEAYWFLAFLSSTDEKDITARVLCKLLNVIMERIQYNPNSKPDLKFRFMDIGFGEGKLSRSVLAILKGVGIDAYYTGIEQNADFVTSNTKELGVIGHQKCSIITSDCFNEGLEHLPANPSLILVSHVAYYAPNIKQFIDSIISKMAQDTIVIFIHASHLSNHNMMRSKYRSEVQTDAARDIAAAIYAHNKLKAHNNLEIHNLMFNSFIFFKQYLDQHGGRDRDHSKNGYGSSSDSAHIHDETLGWSQSVIVENIANAEYKHVAEPGLTLRHLMEFIIQKPMDGLESDIRQSYVTDLRQVLRRQLDKFFIWSSMQIVIPKNSIYVLPIRQAVRDFVLYRDDMNFSPVHWAAFEGRCDILIEFITLIEGIRVEDGDLEDKSAERQNIVNLENLGIITPLYMAALGSINACDKIQDFENTVRLLIARGADARSIGLSLELTARHEITSINKILKSKFKDICEQTVDIRAQSLPRVKTCLIKDIKILNWLFDHLPTLMHKSSYYCDELIESAIVDPHIEVLNVIKQRNDALLKGTFGYKKRSICHMIAENGKVGLLEWLIANLPENFNRLDSSGNTFVHYAVLRPSIEFFDYCYAKIEDKEIFRVRNYNGHNILCHAGLKTECTYDLLAALYNKDIELFMALACETTTKGASIHMFAAKAGDLKSLELLLQHAPDIFNAVDYKRRNIVYYAYLNSDTNVRQNVLEWIMNNARSVFESRENAHMVVEYKRLALLSFLKKNNVAVQSILDDAKNTIAHYAVIYDQIEVLQWIASNMHEVLKLKNNSGKSVLDLATDLDRNEIKVWLQEHQDLITASQDPLYLFFTPSPSDVTNANANWSEDLDVYEYSDEEKQEIIPEEIPENPREYEPSAIATFAYEEGLGLIPGVVPATIPTPTNSPTQSDSTLAILSSERTLSLEMEDLRGESQDNRILRDRSYFGDGFRVHTQDSDIQDSKAQVWYIKNVVYHNHILNSLEGVNLLKRALQIGGVKLYNLVLELGKDKAILQELLSTLPSSVDRTSSSSNIGAINIDADTSPEIILYRLLGIEALKQELMVRNENGQQKLLILYIDQASGAILRTEWSTSAVTQTQTLKLDTVKSLAEDEISKGLQECFYCIASHPISYLTEYYITQKATEVIQYIMDTNTQSVYAGIVTLLSGILDRLESGLCCAQFSPPPYPFYPYKPKDDHDDFGGSGGGHGDYGGTPHSHNGSFVAVSGANATDISSNSH